MPEFRAQAHAHLSAIRGTRINANSWQYREEVVAGGQISNSATAVVDAASALLVGHVEIADEHGRAQNGATQHSTERQNMLVQIDSPIERLKQLVGIDPAVAASTEFAKSAGTGEG